MPAADHAEHDDQAEQQESVDETDDGEVGAELRLVPRGDEQHHYGCDEEDQQEGADQLSKVCRKSSFLHSLSSY